MSHTPPVPPENKSPFPIEEPPHAASAPGAAPSEKTEEPSALVATATSTDTAKTQPSDHGDSWAMPEAKRGWPLGRIVGAAAGLGAVAIGVAAILFPRDDKPQPKRKKRKS